MLWFVIIGCELGFWVLLAAGLAVRYVLKRRRLSSVLLWCVPLLDVVLLVASIMDMRNGATAEVRHGLAAAYIGYSVMFGHDTIRWIDEKVAYRFAGGPKPEKLPKYGAKRVRFEIVLMVKILGAYAVAWAVTGILVWSVGDPDRTAPVVGFTAGLLKVVLICAVISVFDILTAMKKRSDPDEVTSSGSGASRSTAA